MNSKFTLRYIFSNFENQPAASLENKNFPVPDYVFYLTEDSAAQDSPSSTLFCLVGAFKKYDLNNYSIVVVVYFLW